MAIVILTIMNKAYEWADRFYEVIVSLINMSFKSSQFTSEVNPFTVLSIELFVRSSVAFLKLGFW